MRLCWVTGSGFKTQNQHSKLERLPFRRIYTVGFDFFFFVCLFVLFLPFMSKSRAHLQGDSGHCDLDPSQCFNDPQVDWRGKKWLSFPKTDVSWGGKKSPLSSRADLSWDFTPREVPMAKMTWDFLNWLESFHIHSVMTVRVPKECHYRHHLLTIVYIHPDTNSTLKKMHYRMISWVFM